MSKNVELYKHIEDTLTSKPTFKLIYPKLSKYTTNKIEKLFSVNIKEERVSKNDIGVYKIQKLK